MLFFENSGGKSGAGVRLIIQIRMTHFFRRNRMGEKSGLPLARIMAGQQRMGGESGDMRRGRAWPCYGYQVLH